MLQFMGSQRVRHDWVTEQPQQQVRDHTNSRTLGMVLFFFPHYSAMATEVNANKTPVKVFICILFLFQNKITQYHSP